MMYGWLIFFVYIVGVVLSYGALYYADVKQGKTERSDYRNDNAGPSFIWPLFWFVVFGCLFFDSAGKLIIKVVDDIANREPKSKPEDKV